MERINDWLEKFKIAWLSCDIDGVLELFSEDVEYWETPFKRLSGLEEIRKEWQVIKDQKDIGLSFEIVSSAENSYSVKWELIYMNSQGVLNNWRGVYLVGLNNLGKCNYFFQCGESSN